MPSSRPALARHSSPRSFIAKTLATVCLALGTGALHADTWTNVSTTGGGYFTAMNFAFDVPDLQILRSDVSGPWMRTSPTASWGVTRWPAGSTNPPPEADGAGGLAIQPGSGGQVMFAEFGNGFTASNVIYNMGIYKSTNRGVTWNQVLGKYVAANGTGKFAQPIVIDPLNPNIVYWGTKTQGVWRSLDVGATWDADTSTPGIDPVSSILEPNLVPPANVPTTNTGSRNIVFGLNTPQDTLDYGRSRNVYISVFRDGVYRSTQGGEKDTFVKIPNQLTNFDEIYDMEIDGAGDLYICTPKGVAKLTGSIWTDITPSGFFKGGKRAFIALDKTFGTKNRLILSGQSSSNLNNTEIWRSFNGGTAWQGPFSSTPRGNDKLSAPVAAWADRWIGAGASNIEVDPHNEGNFYILDSFQVWKCDNVWTPAIPTAAAPLPFNLATYGVENLVILSLHTPKNGATQLYSGVSDVRGFRHLSLTTSPSDNLNLPTINANTDYIWSYCVSYASCEANPQNVWVANHPSEDGYKGRIFRSVDNGVSFTGGWEPGPIDHGATMIAVSANDPNNAVIFPSDTPPLYTLDGGETWNTSKNASNATFAADDGFFPSTGAYFRDPCLAADKVNGNNFYAFKTLASATNPVGAYWSSNRGATWNLSATVFPALPGGRVNTTAPIDVKTPPGRTGEVWACLNSSGLWRSTNSGSTYSEVTDFKRVSGTGFINVAFGKPAPGSLDSEPIVYVYGTLNSNSKRGYFYSTNYFTTSPATWTQITGFEEATKFPQSMEADRRIPGRLYVGSSWGVGTCVVDAFASNPIKVSEPVDLVASTGGPTRVVLNWVDNSPNETGFKIERRTLSGAFAQIGTAATNATTYTDNAAALTANTTYIYRLRATTGPDNSVYSNESTVRTTATGGDGAALGRTTIGTFTNSSLANELNVFRVTATADFTATQMKVYLANAVTGKINLAIYSDNSGAPGTLLKATTERTNPAAGWQTFNLTSAQTITAGTTYWLATWGNAAYSTRTDFTRGTTLRRTASTYAATWPAGNLIIDGDITATDSLYIEDPLPPLVVWQTTYFTAEELANPAIGGNSADPDGDGTPNLLEFATNTLPRSASPAPSVLGVSGGKLTLTFTRINPTPVRYIVSASEDLTSSWSPIATLEPNTTTWNTVGGAVATGINGPIDIFGNITRIITITDGTLFSTKPKRFLSLTVE